MPVDYEIRRANGEEIALLPDLEEEATMRFWNLEAMRDMPDDITSIDDLVRAHELGHVWVAATLEGDLIGFGYGTVLDECFHLEELAVTQSWGRRGIGRALVAAIADHAAKAGHPGLTLTTFRDVEWNAPLYARLGFRILEPSAWTAGLAEAVRNEESRGLASALRVVMRLDL